MHTTFTIHLDNGTKLTFTVSGERDSVKSYVLIGLKNVDEVIEVFDVYQDTTLVPVRKVTHVEFPQPR